MKSLLAILLKRYVSQRKEITLLALPVCGGGGGGGVLGNWNHVALLDFVLDIIKEKKGFFGSSSISIFYFLFF